MTLPLSPPVPPALALSRRELPSGEDYVYEIKLDGFRCIAFVDGDDLICNRAGQSRCSATSPSSRSPPGATCSTARSSSAMSLVVSSSTRCSSASTRPSRGSQLLSGEIPATYVAFDLLAYGDDTLLELPFAERRSALERLLADPGFVGAPIELMLCTTDPGKASVWLRDAEGAIAKRRSAPYAPGKRTGMFKVKRVRTIDAVVTGWRPGKEPDTVGALILALYDGPELRVVGHCSGLTASEKHRLVVVPRSLPDWRAGLCRPQPLERRAGSGVGRAAPRAGR